MLDIETIFQFSRNNCVAICAFLVPINLLTTIQTFILLLSQRPVFQLLSATVAIAFALTLFLHIATWFIIGVITPVTFILAGLGATCIMINLALIVYKDSILKYFFHWKTALQSRSRRGEAHSRSALLKRIQ